MATQIQELVNSETVAQARDQLVRVNDELQHWDQQVRQLVRERPIASLLAAAFVGHLVGRLFSR